MGASALNRLETITHRLTERDAILRGNERKFRAIAETLPIGIYWYERGVRRELYINPECSRIIGVSQEEATIDNWVRNLCPEIRESLRRDWLDFMNGKGEWQRFYCFEHSGKHFEVLSRAVRKPFGEGDGMAFLGFLLEVPDGERG